MSISFSDLGLIPELLETVTELGYVEPTPIQAEAIPALLAGYDVMGQAQTGTGKTAAFALPMLNHLAPNGLQVLVLAPTRELASQTAEAIYRYGNKLNVRVLPIYGGQPYERQVRRLERGVQVVVGTPGRTLDLIRQRRLICARCVCGVGRSRRNAQDGLYRRCRSDPERDGRADASDDAVLGHAAQRNPAAGEHLYA